MEQYISKSALVAEIDRLIAELVEEGEDTMFEQGRISALEDVKVFINHTLEVKDANEALRTEYEKGRADVIADTLSWLANVWPQYCSNPTIIDGFKEAIKGE